LVLANKAGGFGPLVQLLASYLQRESQPSSLLFGASVAPAQRMFLAAVVWNLLGALSWIWAVPAASRRLACEDWGRVALFLAAWFLPAFLFHSFIHVGDPDQTLVTIPVVCLLGGLVLARFLESSPRRSGLRWALTLTLATGFNALLFFRPLPSPANAASYRVVRWVDDNTNTVFSAIEQLRAHGPLFFVSCQAPVTWRKVAYYFPDDPVLVLSACPEGGGELSTAWIAQYARTRSPVVRDGEIVLPRDRTIVWLLPADPELKKVLGGVVALRQHGAVSISEPRLGDKFEFAGFQFVYGAPQELRADY
jgi:hypothetical protein